MTETQVASRTAVETPQRTRRPPSRADRAEPAVRPQERRPLGLFAALDAALTDRRGFIVLPFAMVAGVVASANLAAEPSPVLLWVGAGLIAMSLVSSGWSLLRLRIAVLAAAFWTGFCLLPLHGALLGTPMLQRPAYGTYEVRVDEILSETPNEKRILVSQIQPLEGARALPVRRARLLVKAGPDLSPGDVLSGAFRFAPVPGPVYPGGFDTQFHAYFDGIGAYGNSTRPPTIISAGDEWAVAHVIDSVRRGIATRVDAVLPQPHAGIARAIINGDQSAVTDEVREEMATAGIVHVLSVSGLHLTMVAGTVFAVLRLLLSGWETAARYVSAKRLAAGAGIVAAVAYFAISGGNVAAFRSTLMIVLVFGAVLFGRRALTMRNVAIAALVVVVTDPASIFRPSFQLSFAAVVALVGAYEELRGERLRDASVLARSWGYFKGIVITSLVAGGATMLFSIYHFQQTSPLGVLGNLLTLPIVGFVMMPAALVAVLAMPFGLEGPFLAAMGWSIEWMLQMGRLVAGWSTHLTASPLLTPLALLFGLAALSWFALLKGRWRLAGPVLMVPAVLLVALDRPPDVMIADTTRAIAIRGTAGLELADGKSASFALDVWRETYTEPIDAKAATSCDSVACIGESAAGFSYAVVVDPAGFAEECGRDLIIARMRAPSWCAAGTVIDTDTLRERGVHWLRWDAGRGAFEVRPAIDQLERNWRIRP